MFSENTTGMPVFPLEYVLDPDFRKAHIICRTMENEIIAMFIHPKDADVQRSQQNDAFTIPTVSVFAETGRRAKMPCSANFDNSKTNPFGILLCEQVEKGKMFNSAFNGRPIQLQAYRCKWASILREDVDMPNPAIGIGFIEVNYASGKEGTPQSYSSIQGMIREYLDILNNPNTNPLDKNSQLQRKFEEITVTRKKLFSAVVMKHKGIIDNFPMHNINDLRSTLEALTNPLSVNGRYGIVMIRVRSGNIVSSKCSARYSRGFNYEQRRPMTDNEAWTQFMKYEFKKFKHLIGHQNVSFDLMPAQKINFAQKGIRKYSNELCRISPPSTLLPAGKIMKQYIDSQFHFRPDVDLVKSNAFLASWIGVRTAYTKNGSDAGNHIASTVHSFSKTFGNALQLTQDLKPTLIMDFRREEKKAANG